jgi:hypothetical protein
MTVKVSFCEVTVHGYKSEIGAHCSRYLISIEQFQVLNVCKLSLIYLNQSRTNWIERGSSKILTEYAVTAIELLLVADGTTPTAL